MQILYATFGLVPELDKDDVWEETRQKIRRGFPWLLDDGHQVRLLGVGRGWRGLRQRAGIRARALIPATGIFPIDAGLIWFIHFFAACIRAAGREHVVVAATTPMPGLGDALAKAIFGRRIPLIVRVQSFSTSRALYLRKSRWQHWLLNKIEGFVVRSGDLIVTGNEATTNLALSYGVERGRIIVMPWPVAWTADAEITDLPACPTVLHAGRLEKEKGVYLLLEAMKAVIAELPSATLLIAGGGNERRGMEKMAAKLGLDEHVSFLGWLGPPELMAAYKRSTVLVLPSVYEEGLGMVLVEAGLMGRPVVCSGTGGMGEVVKHGDNGLVVPRGDVRALADAILKILKDPDSARRMGLAGRKYAENFLAGRERSVEEVRQAALDLASRYSPL